MPKVRSLPGEPPAVTELLLLLLPTPAERAQVHLSFHPETELPDSLPQIKAGRG